MKVLLNALYLLCKLLVECKLESELVTQKAQFQEQESLLSRELKATIRKNNELHEHLKLFEESRIAELRELEQKHSIELEKLKVNHEQLIRRAYEFFKQDSPSECITDEGLLDCLFKFKKSNEQSTCNQERFIEELQKSLKEKSEALEFYNSTCKNLESEKTTKLDEFKIAIAVHT